jgi:hypothetical protein
MQEDDFAEWAATDPETWLSGYRHVPAWSAEVLAAVERRRNEKRAGRKPIPPEILERAANFYREAFARNEPARMAVAKRMNVSPSQASKYIDRARKAGLLPATTRGRAQA